MINWKRNLFFLCLAQFFSMAGFGFALPFIPFYIRSLGVDDPAETSIWVAQFAAAGSLSYCLSAPVWGFLSDIYGRRVMVLRGNFAGAVVMPLMAFVPGVGWLIFLRFLLGLFSGTATATQVLASGSTPPGSRGVAMGAISSMIYGGMMTGTCLGGIVVDGFGYRTAFFICGLMLAFSGLLALFGVRENFQKTVTLREKLGALSLELPDFGPMWMILSLVAMIGFATQFDLPFLPMLVEAVNGPEKAATWTGLIASIAAVSGVFSGPFLGWLADRSSPQKVAVFSAFAAGLLMLPQAAAGSFGVLLLTRVGMVFFAGGLDPVFQAWLARLAPDSRRGLLFGWATSAKTFGWFLSSLAGGSVAALLGVRWVYAVSAVIFLLLIPAIRMTVRGLENK